MTALDYLTNDDFAGRVNLTPGFDLDTLSPYVRAAVEETLPNLLIPADLTLYTASLTAEAIDPTSRTGQLRALIIPFLVYSAWAGYVLEGGIVATETGLVEKQRTTDSLTITDAHRAELRRLYRDRASMWANKITDFSANDTACVSPVRTGMRLGKAVGRTVSRFDQPYFLNRIDLP